MNGMNKGEFKCPECQGKEFLEGPHGGNSINFACANCWMRFNDAVWRIEQFGIIDNPEDRELFTKKGFIPWGNWEKVKEQGILIPGTDES